MSRCYCRNILPLTILFALVVPVLSTARGEDVPLYRLFEKSVTNNNSYGNRFRDVDLNVTYNHPGTGKTVNFYGFFDGDGNGGGNAGSGNVWKMRFMPDELGTWNYTWSWSDSTPGGSGSFNCVATNAGKGIIKAYQNNRNWFAYNGTDPVFLKSYYIKPHHVMTQDINQVAPKAYQKLVDRGYNHFQMAGLLPVSYKHQILEDCGPHIDAYLYSNASPSSTMRLDIWNQMDKHMKWLNDHDVGVHFFEGFDGKEQGPRWSSLSTFEREYYVKYVCARMAPMAIVCGFNFTYETNDGANERQLVDLLDQFDPWDHLRTYMQGTYHANEFYNGWWNYHNYLFVAAEVVSPDRNGCIQSAWEVHDHMWAAQDAYDKPVFHSECWGMWRSCYGACEDSVRRTAWANTFTAAASTWNDMPSCETGNNSSHIFSYGNAAMAIDIMADVMNNEIEFWKMNPYGNVNNNGIALAEPGRQYAVYKQNGGGFDLNMDAGSYDGKWINCVNGQQNIIGTVNHGGGNRYFSSPFGGTDSVLVLVDLDPCVPVSLDATAVSTSQIDLTWVIDPACNEAGIRVERSQGAGFSEIAQLGANTTSYSDTGLAENTAYTYRVRADLGGGNYSEYSDTDTEITLPTLPDAPSNLAATARQAELVIDLSWTDNSDNEDGFKIERKSQDETEFTEVATVGGGTVAHADTGLLTSTTYTYRVSATNRAGDSAYSNQASARTACISEPINVDDFDPAITYTGTWSTKENEPTRYMGTLHESQSAGATASLSFEGGSIDLYADTRGWGGTASVMIDGISVASADFNGPDADSVLVASYTNLGSGSHDLVMTIDGNGWCYVDYFVYTPVCSGAENAPADPSNLAAIAAGHSQIDLTWLDNAGDNQDEEIDYRVERKAAGEATFTEIATVAGVFGTGNTIQYSDGGLDFATEYCYRVRAYNQVEGADMYSNYTGESCETTDGPPDPNPPAGLVATLGDGRITLTWDANTETNPPVLYYKVHRSTTDGGPYNVVAVAFGGTNIIDSQVLVGTTYYYCVSAVDTWAHESLLSNEATPHIPDPPTEAPALTATGGVSMITLDWTDTNDNEDGFVIERKLDTETEFVEIATVGLVSQHVDAGLLADTTYDYRIYAYNVDGNGPMSNIATATTESCTPTDETVDDADGMISYSGSWNAQSGWSGRYDTTLHETDSSGAYAEITITGDSIELIADLQPYGGNAQILIDGTPDATISFNGTTAYQQIVYSKSELGSGEHTIRIVCQGGGWTYIDAIHYFGCPVPPTPPAAPTGLTATANGCSQVNLAWTDNAGNETGFKIEQKIGTGSFIEVATAGENVQSLLVSGLTELTAYTYRVRAYNSLYDSAYSNEDSATTGECGSLPQFETISWGGGWGTITEVDNGYDMTLAGWEIAAHVSNDECFFAYQPITGDFDIAFQVFEQEMPDHGFEPFWAKAGVMARFDLSSDAKFVANFGRGRDNGDVPPLGMVEWRWVDGGTTPGGGAQAHSVYSDPPAEIPDQWRRLKRVGTEFFGYISADGVNWQLIKHVYTEFGGNVPDTLYVGFTGASKSSTVALPLKVRNVTGFNP